MSGYVVEHKDLPGTRYGVSERNYNPKIHKKIRDLKPGETPVGYRPRRTGALQQETQQGLGSAGGSNEAAGDAAETSASASSVNETEGSAPADAKGK